MLKIINSKRKSCTFKYLMIMVWNLYEGELLNSKNNFLNKSNYQKDYWKLNQKRGKNKSKKFKSQRSMVIF